MISIGQYQRELNTVVTSSINHNTTSTSDTVAGSLTITSNGGPILLFTSGASTGTNNGYQIEVLVAGSHTNYYAIKRSSTYYAAGATRMSNSTVLPVGTFYMTTSTIVGIDTNPGVGSLTYDLVHRVASGTNTRSYVVGVKITAIQLRNPQELAG